MLDAESDWLLDTSILIDILRGHQSAKNWIDSLPEIARRISVITAAEILAGCHDQTEQRRAEREPATYSTLWIDEEISQSAIELYSRYHLSHGVGFLDCLIAASAIKHGLQLATVNLKHFAPIPHLQAKRPY